MHDEVQCQIEMVRLTRQNEILELEVQQATEKLALARAELDHSEVHREHTRRWLRGELNYDPLDLTPWLCLWCGCKIEGGRQGAKDHAVSCADNPLVARCDRMRKVLTGPIRQTDGATLDDLLDEMCSGDLDPGEAWKVNEAICNRINEALSPTTEKPADDAATVQPGDGSRQDL